MTPPRGRGPSDAQIMFVGEAWGRYEEMEGKPFVGPAGRRLNELLLKSGIDPDGAYYTNIVNARPPSNDLGAWIPEGIPSDQVLDGIDSLLEEIESIKPNVIVPLGNWPLWVFYPREVKKQKDGKWSPTGILDYRGYILESRKLARGSKVIPTVHPSYLLQGGAHDAPLAILDLKRVKEQAKFPEVRRRPRLAIVDPDSDQRESLRTRLLEEGRYLVVDIEYIGSNLLCIGFAVSPEWAVSIRTDSAEDLAWCQALIESGRPLAAQNGMFDLGILDWHYHIDAFHHLQFDTMVGAYNINIEYKKDLGFLGGLYTDIWPWWDKIDWNKIKAGKQSIDEVLEYNCYDNMVTYEVLQQQDVELDFDPKTREAFRFDMSKLRPLWEIARRGIRIDTKALNTLKVEVEADRSAAQAKLNVIAEGVGMDLRGVDLNVKSGPAIAEFLTNLGIRLTQRTPPSSRFPKGQLKTDNVTLMEVMRNATGTFERRTLELIIRAREARDITSKFTEIEWDTDQRSRCIYDCTKTGTRRLSSKKFFPTGRGSNLQNVPAPSSSSYGQRARRIFTADPGFEFGYADLKGAEFLIVAHLTQDPLMLRYAQMSIEGTGDIHRETAAYIFSRITGKKILPEEIAKDSPQRFLGKKTRHSGNYMVGWKELMGRINAEAMDTGVFVTAAETKAILAGYIELHPGLPRWWDATSAELYAQGGVLRNLFGFPRRFNGYASEILPQAVAFVPQSTVGDALNFGLVACHNDPQLRDAGLEILLNVHDAIGFQYPVSNRDEVLVRVNELMSIPITIPRTGDVLRIPVETEIGPNWGDLETWHHA